MEIFRQHTLLISVPVFFAILAFGWLWVQWRRSRRAAFIQWQAYLNNIDTSLQNLVTLDNALRPYFQGEDRKMNEPGFQLHQIVEREVKALRQQIDEYLHFRDYLFSTAPIDWRPFPDLADHLATLVGLAGNRVQESKAAQSQAQDILGILEQNLGNLEAHNNDVGERMRKLVGQFSDLSDLWPEKNETSIQRAEGSLFEEGIAARLMAELQGGLPIEEITDRLSRVETEIELRRKILAETPLSPSLREEVQVRLDWVIQMKRWWSLQKRLYNQDNLLKECSGKMQEITDTDYKQRFQEWLDSLAQREEIDTLHNKIGDLMVEKRMALKYAETIQKDQGTIQNIKKILLQVEGIQESSSGDIQMTKDVLKKVDAVLQETLDKKQVRYYENALEQARSEANEARRETTALRNQVADNHKTLAGEKEKFEQAIKIMQYALEEATIGKKELEEGLAQLQESYAALKKRLEKHTN